MGLKNILNDKNNVLSTNKDEIINVLEPQNVKADVSESMKITESYHETEVELTLKLEESKINGTDQSFVVLVLVASCLKLCCLSPLGPFIVAVILGSI